MSLLPNTLFHSSVAWFKACYQHKLLYPSPHPEISIHPNPIHPLIAYAATSVSDGVFHLCVTFLNSSYIMRGCVFTCSGINKCVNIIVQNIKLTSNVGPTRPEKKFPDKPSPDKAHLIMFSLPLREDFPYQNGWIFGKVPNGLWPPLPPIRKIILWILRKGHILRDHQGNFIS